MKKSKTNIPIIIILVILYFATWYVQSQVTGIEDEGVVEIQQSAVEIQESLEGVGDNVSSIQGTLSGATKSVEDVKANIAEVQENYSLSQITAIFRSRSQVLLWNLSDSSTV